MFVAAGELVADLGEQVVGQLRLDDNPTPSLVHGGGGPSANFCTWVVRLGGRARLVTPADDGPVARHMVGQVEARGVEVCSTGGSPEPYLEGAALLYVEARSLLASPIKAMVRGAVEAARRHGLVVAIDLGDDAWISAHGAPRTAYQLATLRPDVLFASRAATAQLAVPLEGLSSVPILQLGEDGCSVYGRRLVAPLLLNGAGLGRGEETMTSTPRHPAEDAFAAAFCVAFIEGHAPVEAAARALLVSSPRT